MQRPGRQFGNSSFLGAEIATLTVPEFVSQRALRSASFAGRAAIAAAAEAYTGARLDGIDPFRLGLILGGSNMQQRELTQTHDAFRDRSEFVRPTYGMTFLDTDIVALCSAELGLKGPCFTIGGSSASGQAAIIQAAALLRSDQADACVVIGGLMDLSHWECSALRSMGAMGSDRYADRPAEACRPFDRSRDGFIFGECCAALVLESASSARSRSVAPLAQLAGWSFIVDAKRTTDPSLEGEIHVIRSALLNSGMQAPDIDYINPHGSGSLIGDETEVAAIKACSLDHARINTTKSLTGHGLTAAGVVEVVATLLQMHAGRLHPSRNLDEPIDASLHWVRERSEAHTMRRALTLSIGFGGVNTALCWHDCR